MLLILSMLIEITYPKTQNDKRILQFTVTAYNNKKNRKHVVQKRCFQRNYMKNIL